MQDVDVVVIGAGAAGVGAGMALSDLGKSFVILEAADRIGGRAYTDTTSLPVAWDQGCHWMHSANLNPLVAEADRVGTTYLREMREDSYRYWWRGGWLAGDDLAATGRALDQAFDAIYAAAEDGRDVAASDVIDWSTPYAPGVRHILQLMAGSDPEDTSTSGYGDYNDTETNWPVISGYGDLIERLAVGLPLRTGVPVRAVDELAGGVRVTTDQGEIRARTAIVTVSTNVLRSGSLHLTGSGAQAIRDFADAVPCGSYEKVAILLKRPVPGLEKVLFCTIQPDPEGPLNFQIATGQRQLMIAHFGGGLAKSLSEEGSEALESYAFDRLKLIAGNDVMHEVDGVATTGWQKNPCTLGAYSVARPGHAQIRRDMIGADTGHIVLAGEALSPDFQATAHGAWMSGQAVARRIAAG